MHRGRSDDAVSRRSFSRRLCWGWGESNYPDADVIVRPKPLTAGSYKGVPSIELIKRYGEICCNVPATVVLSYEIEFVAVADHA